MMLRGVPSVKEGWVRSELSRLLSCRGAACCTLLRFVEGTGRGKRRPYGNWSNGQGGASTAPTAVFIPNSFPGKLPALREEFSSV